METELKFKLRAGQSEQAERILASRYPDAPVAATHLVTTYFDTPDLAVAKAGFTLRVRHAGDNFTQTVKSAAITGGHIAQRFEKEWRIRSAKPDFRRLAGTPIAELGPRVAPLFVTDLDRTAYSISVGGGATVEVAIDQGEIRAGDRREPVQELEIELKAGPPDALYAFVAAFHAELPLEIATESKAERGYRLAADRPPESRKAGPLELGKDITVADGVKAIVGHELAHLTANLAAIDDIEGLHQVRVAIRRLRSALVLFEKHIEPHAAGRFEAALKRFGQILGDGRDWDVLVSDAIPRAERDGIDRRWLDLLANHAAPIRAQARATAKDLAAGGEFTGFILALAAWIETLDRTDNGALAKTPLTDIAPNLLSRLQRKAMKRGRHIARLEGEALHALRKTLKKLRYGTDYLVSLYPKKATKKYRDACNDLQDVLGGINDAATAERLLARLGEGDDLQLTPAIGLFAEWTTKRRARALKELPRVWRDFEKVPLPWR